MSRTKKLEKRTKFMILRNFKIGYDFRFDPIKAYLESTQEMILTQERELEEKFKKWNEEHSENPEMPDAFDIYEMEILNSSEFPNILNKSIYLTIYSMFENEFNKLCEWCQHSEELNLSPKDLKGGNYIGQCRNYIIKVLNVNLENLKEQWTKIGKYQQIRNVIAHNNGIVKQTNKEIPKFVDSTQGISIEQKTSEIQIESIDFLIDFIDHLVGFLNETIEEIVNQKEKAST
ncbi:hypothetical protein [uncultured Tenacibaculum sp.]|uniref:hypothetical protein n=1 Tax=uncultured Tenacibaculum sp. TaxID=174713 RepID=UPI00262AA6E0|nr:hypothetical protein [uncultured Tenacibaculum sp.]